MAAKRPQTPPAPPYDPGLAAHLVEYPDASREGLPPLPAGFALDAQPTTQTTPPLPAGFTLDAPSTAPQSRTQMAKQTLSDYQGSTKGIGDLLKSLAYNFTIGPFEQAGQMFGQPFEAHRQALAGMSGNERAAYLAQPRMTPLEKLMAPPGTYSDEELMTANDPLFTLGLLGALGSKSVGGVPTGPGTGFFRRAPETPPPPPPRPMRALPPAPPYETLIGDIEALPQAEKRRLLNLQPEVRVPPRVPSATERAASFDRLQAQIDAKQATQQAAAGEQRALLNQGPPPSTLVKGRVPQGPPPLDIPLPIEEPGRLLAEQRAAAEMRLPVPSVALRPGKAVPIAPVEQAPPSPVAATTVPVEPPALPSPRAKGAKSLAKVPPLLEPPVAPEVTARLEEIRYEAEHASGQPYGKQYGSIETEMGPQSVAIGNAGSFREQFAPLYPEFRNLPNVGPNEIATAIKKDKNNKLYTIIKDAVESNLEREGSASAGTGGRTADEILGELRADRSSLHAQQPSPEDIRAAQVFEGNTAQDIPTVPPRVSGGVRPVKLPQDYSSKEWEIQIENLRDSADVFGKGGGAREGGRLNYELQDLINEFGDFAKKLNTTPINESLAIFKKQSSASETKFRQLKTLLSDAGLITKKPTPVSNTAFQAPLFRTQAEMPPTPLQGKVPQVEHGNLLEGFTPEAPKPPELPLGTGELHAGLPIPPKLKEWAKRNIGALGRATTQAAGNIPSEPTNLLDRAALVEQQLRDVRQLRTPPPIPPTGQTAGAGAQSSGVPPPPVVTDINVLPRYYSTKLANQNRTRPLMSGGFHGMNQVAEAAPESAHAFRAASNAEHTWGYAVTQAKDLINKQSGPGAFDRFTSTMSESQQRGNIKRWADLAKEVAAADPHDVPDIYRERAGDALLSAGEAPFKVGEQIADRFKTATTDAGQLNNAVKLQQHLVQSFTDASQNVTHVLDEPTYRAQLNSPEFKQSLPIWKKAVGNDLTAAHVENSGHVLKPEYLGDTGQYFPMTGKAASEQAASGLGGKRPAGPYSKPGNPLNFRRSGLSQEYDLSTKALQTRIGSAGWAADNAKAIAQAEADGLIRKVPPGTPAKNVPRTYDFNGVTYKAERVGDHVMPSWVRDEIGPIFERFRRPGQPTGALGWAANKIVGLNTKLGVDKFFHYVNETGLLGAQAPTIGRTTLGRTVGSLPGIKTGHAFTTLFNTITEAERPAVMEMLRNGEWYPRFKDNGELSSMARRDLAGRLTFRQAIQRWKPDATPQELYDASTRFGEYNPQLASNMVRAIKNSPVFSPLAPFVTAGNAFVRNSLGTLTMQGPGGATARLTAAATGGIPAALGTWVAIHLGMTGKLPDPSDPDFKFLQVPYGETSEGRTKYLDIGKAVAPLSKRGATASGLTPVLETLARGGTSQQAFESALASIIASQTHPYIGPAVKVGTRLLTGRDPQFQFQGGDMSLRRAHPPSETLPGLIGANVKSALEAVNPAVERFSKPIERALGVPGSHDPTEGMSAIEQAAQAIGLISVSDNRQRERMLRWGAKQTQRAARRAQR